MVNQMNKKMKNMETTGSFRGGKKGLYRGYVWVIYGLHRVIMVLYWVLEKKKEATILGLYRV